MALPVLEQTVAQALQGGGEHVAFGWQGGEPTLLGLPFFLEALRFQHKYRRKGQHVSNGLQTNGLLIDDAWCGFLSASRWLVGLSIDGPQDLHDLHRTARNERGTYEQVRRAAERMLAGGVEVNVLTVVTREAAPRAAEIYEHHNALGLQHMQFVPAVDHDPRNPAALRSHTVSGDAYGDFLCALFDCWTADFDNGWPTVSVRQFEDVFHSYLGLPPPACTLMASCGDYVVVEHDGSVYSCDFYVEESHRLGDVMQSSLADMLGSAQQRAFGERKRHVPSRCRTCPWLGRCRAGCPREWRETLRGMENHLCEGYARFFAHADTRLKELAGRWKERAAEG